MHSASLQVPKTRLDKISLPCREGMVRVVFLVRLQSIQLISKINLLNKPKQKGLESVEEALKQG